MSRHLYGHTHGKCTTAHIRTPTLTHTGSHIELSPYTTINSVMPNQPSSVLLFLISALIYKIYNPEIYPTHAQKKNIPLIFLFLSFFFFCLCNIWFMVLLLLYSLTLSSARFWHSLPPFPKQYTQTSSLCSTRRDLCPKSCYYDCVCRNYIVIASRIILLLFGHKAAF